MRSLIPTDSYRRVAPVMFSASTWRVAAVLPCRAKSAKQASSIALARAPPSPGATYAEARYIAHGVVAFVVGEADVGAGNFISVPSHTGELRVGAGQHYEASKPLQILVPGSVDMPEVIAEGLCGGIQQWLQVLRIEPFESNAVRDPGAREDPRRNRSSSRGNSALE